MTSVRFVGAKITRAEEIAFVETKDMRERKREKTTKREKERREKQLILGI